MMENIHQETSAKIAFEFFLIQLIVNQEQTKKNGIGKSL